MFNLDAHEQEVDLAHDDVFQVVPVRTEDSARHLGPTAWGGARER